MKKLLLFILPLMLSLVCMSCISEDDFLQEGTLRVNVQRDMDHGIDSNVKIHVIVADAYDKTLHIAEKRKTGTGKIDLTLNTGNYRVFVYLNDNFWDDYAAQVRKGRVTELNI